MKIQMVDIGLIVRPDMRMRQDFDPERLDELKESIKNIGLINPITLKKEGKNYEIMAGDRRFRACLDLGKKEIPAIVYASEGIEAEKIKIAENVVREEVSVIDEGFYLVKIKEKFGLTQKDLAQMINRTESYVHDRVKATEWHPELKVAVKNGSVNFSIARELSKLSNEDQLFQCINSCIEYGTTPDQARKWVRDYKAQEGSGEEFRKMEDQAVSSDEIAPSRLLQSCQVCKDAYEPRDMIYLTICRTCSDTIKKAI